MDLSDLSFPVSPVKACIVSTIETAEIRGIPEGKIKQAPARYSFLRQISLSLPLSKPYHNYTAAFKIL
jgi:hypothetical protein